MNVNTVIYNKTSNLELVNVAQKEAVLSKIEQWNQFHQHKMLCYSTINKLPTKLAFEPQVIYLSRNYLVQKDKGGN